MPTEAKGKAKAAREEVTDDLRTVETQGLTLTIPTKMPFAVLQFLNDTPGPQEIVGVLNALLDPKDQIQKVWDAGLDMDQGGALITDLIAAAGVTPGESSASQGS